MKSSTRTTTCRPVRPAMWPLWPWWKCGLMMINVDYTHTWLMNIWWYSNNMWIIYSQPYVDLIIVQYMWFHDSIILTYTHQCLGRLSIREIPTWTRFFHETAYFWTNTALILVCESIWDCAQKYGGHFGNGYVLILSSRAFGSIVPAHSHPQKQNIILLGGAGLT